MDKKLNAIFTFLPRKGVLVIFVYGGVRGMLLGLRFHMKAILGGLKFVI